MTGKSSGITDTSKLSPAEKHAVAGTEGGVLAQEAQGQRELVASDRLPIRGLLGKDRPRWEALGVQIFDGESDGMFCRVELPPGWRKVPTDHSMWTNLVDATGKVRAKIFYKAAFYDRSADVYLETP